MGVHVVKRHAIVDVQCVLVVNVVIGVRIVVLSVPPIVVHFVVLILLVVILYQFIHLFSVAILSHMFSLYSHGILGVVFTLSSTLHYRRLNILLVSTSAQVLSPIGIVLVEELADSRLCGFALALDRLAKSLAFNLYAYSSNCTSEVSCSLSFKFVTNLFQP